MSFAVDLANAVVEELNSAGSGSFSRSFTAAFERRPNFDRLQADSLSVVVFLGKFHVETTSRSTMSWMQRIGIALVMPVSAESTGLDNDDVDDAVDLMQEIVDHFRRKRVAGANMVEASTDIDPDSKTWGEIVFPGNLDAGLFVNAWCMTFRKDRQ